MKKKLVSVILSAAMALSLLSGCGSSAAADNKAASASIPAGSSKKAGSGSTAVAANAIKIGVSGPTTGDSAQSGVNVNTGIQMAIDEINAAGGITIDGTKRQVTAVYYDTGSDAQTGLSNCEKLITSDKVDYLWCETFNSAVGIATMEIAKKYDIPIGTLEPVSSAITDKVKADPDSYKYFFKFGWDSSAYGETCANTVLSLVKAGKLSLPDKKIAICGDETDYGRSNLKSVVEKLKAEGYEVVSENYWDFGSTDLYSVISDIKSSGANMIFSCSTTAATGVALIKQLKENGLGDIPHMAIYFPMMPEFQSQIGDSADKLLFAPMLVDTKHNESNAAFAKKVKDYCGDDMTFDHLDGYSDMMVVLKAMEAAGSTDSAKLSEALLSADGFDVPKGHIVFQSDSHTIKYGEGYVPVNAAQIQGSTPFVIYPESQATSTFQPFK